MSHHAPFHSLTRLSATAAVVLIIASCGSPPVSPTPSAASAPPASGAPLTSADAAGPRACGPASTAASNPAPPPWWRDRIFYEVFVRSFADSNGDGIGDLRGLTQHLDALNDGDPATTDDLGVTALWLMPVAESPSYHGYDVTDYRTIEPDYGTNDDFKALVAAARIRGIDIIVDLVLNHTSIEHPWFQDSRTPGSVHDDWYVWRTDPPTVSGPGGQPVWHRDDDRWYYGYFWEGMPDLNLTNPAVTAELDDIARFWVDEMGVAGFRLDAARHLIEDGAKLENTPATFDWLRRFREKVHADRADALVLGEVWDATSIASRYVRDGALDLTFDFGLAAQMLSAVRFGDAVSLATIQAEVTAGYPPGGYAAFLTNHDQDRTFDVVGRDLARAKQAATLLLTNAGVPFIYYGEEIGLHGRKPDERLRTPMPWTGTGPGFGFTTGRPWEALAADVETTNVEAESADPASLRSQYRDLIALRAAHPALSVGTQLPISASSTSAYAVLRHDPSSGESVAVISNLSGKPAPGVTLSMDDGPLCGSPAVTSLLGGPPAIPAPAIGPAGGFRAWTIGTLAAQQDLVVSLGS